MTGPNLGLEAIAWVPDSYLTASGFFDESKNRAYNPADYPTHGTGLFVVGLETQGSLFFYALTSESFTRVATVATQLPAIMELEFDRDARQLWAVCDDTCTGRSAVLSINTAGRFAPTTYYERPTGMPNINNEGFAIAPLDTCANGRRSTYWADDSETAGQAIRSGWIACTFVSPTTSTTSARPAATAAPVTFGTIATTSTSTTAAPTSSTVPSTPVTTRPVTTTPPTTKPAAVLGVIVEAPQVAEAQEVEPSFTG